MNTTKVILDLWSKRKSIPLDKLLEGIALGGREHDALSCLAGRLIRLEKRLDHELQAEIDLRPTAFGLYCVVCVSHTKLKDSSVQKRAGRCAYPDLPAGVVDLEL